MVIARTLDGDLGILTGHVPVLGELADGVVLITTTDGEVVSAAVHGGFISVENNTVSLLAEVAELSDEIDISRARAALERASTGGGDESLSAAQLRAESRLRAAEARI